MKYSEMVRTTKQELFATTEDYVFTDQSVRWGTVWATRERRPEFDGEPILAGMMWVALKQSVKGRLDPAVRDPLDVVLDQCLQGDDDAVFGVFDVANLETAAEDDLTKPNGNISDMTPMRLWQPNGEGTLDDAAIAVFALGRNGLRLIEATL